ncbi:MAG: 3D-(3,5/4)-trihydroxycyclohexane-1,2-dione acylhydrolase (decyclizing) [Acidimicrobiales bacterium]
MRLTVGQALVRFLVNQWTERDGVEHRLVEGCFGILGHGNVAGFGQALLEEEVKEPGVFPYYQGRNEQSMVHAAVAFARMRSRLSTLACTSSVGPGATNMVTGAALATIDRLPVLLLPSDVFATRVSDPVLQQLEQPGARDLSVNDAFRPVSRFFDRVQRPEQLTEALFGAMRVLSDPAETGAVTVCLPEDVQAEAFDWPEEMFDRRIWHVDRPSPDPGSLDRAAAVLASAKRPLIVAGGGVAYSEAGEVLGAFAESTGIPVAETQAGKGSLAYTHPQAVGGLGSTGTSAANALAQTADVVIGIGTRWTDFTTASRSAFRTPDVRFISCNIARFDAVKLAGVALVGDARATLERLGQQLGGWAVADEYRHESHEMAREWDATVERAYHLGHNPLPAQSEVIGVVNEVSRPGDVVVCASGSMPSDLHKLWRTRGPQEYHVEYGYSCMGYEIAAGLGVKLAAPERDVFVMVGDGAYLMMAQELITAVQEHVSMTVVLVDNHGFASIGSLSDTVGSQRFGTAYRFRNEASGRLDGEVLPVDLAANAESLGAEVYRVSSVAELRTVLLATRSSVGPVVACIETDPLVPGPSSNSWWEVPVAEVAELESTRRARTSYEEERVRQRPYL